MQDNTWHERGKVAIEIEDTEVGREISVYERVDGKWRHRCTLPPDQERHLYELLGTVLFDER